MQITIRNTMMNIITCILAVAVAVLAVVCLRLCHIINCKNRALINFINENMKLKDSILDMEQELQRLMKQ